MSDIVSYKHLPRDSIEKKNDSEGFALPGRCIVDLNDIEMMIWRMESDWFNCILRRKICNQEMVLDQKRMSRIKPRILIQDSTRFVRR